MTNPVDNPELYDAIVLGGVRSPGIVKLSGHDRNVKWDVKAAKGQQGASVSLSEVPLTEFNGEFFLATAAEQEAWKSFVEIIESTLTGTKAKAVDVYHPDLASQKPPIDAVVKATVGGAQHDGLGGVKYVIKFQEYKPPKPKKVEPLGARTKGPDPDAAALAEVEKLTKEYQNTPWG